MEEFLLTICIFDRFTLKLAEHLLTQLITENAFVTFDYDSQVYTMHNILSGYVRYIFDREPVAKRQMLLQMAGKWHFDAVDFPSHSFCQMIRAKSLLISGQYHELVV